MVTWRAVGLPCGISLDAESGFLGAPEEPSEHIEDTGFVQGKCLDPMPHAVGCPQAEHRPCLPACLSLPASFCPTNVAARMVTEESR